MNTVITLLKQPFPAYTIPRRQTLICGVTGLFIFAILYVLEPFGIGRFSEADKLNYALTYSGIAFGVAFTFTVVTPLLFKTVYEEKNWTLQKEILNVFVVVITISWINQVTHHYTDHYPLTLTAFLLSTSYTLIMSLFPFAFSLLVKQRMLQKKNDKAIVSSPTNGADNPPKIVLTGTGVGEIIELTEGDFLYIASADNYAKIHLCENEIIRSVLIRNTLKNMEEKLSPYPMIVRCHRGYIVNLRKVTRVSGDAHGLKLLLEGASEEILVGKTYLTTVKELLDLTPN